ncbi:MAG TPA: response regulator [Chitinophagaceae bacterium]
MASILVIDDDPDLLEMVETALSVHGFSTTTLSSGKVLFETLQFLRPDLIIIDVFLEGIDGRHLCYRIKTEPNLSAIPVILYSARQVSISTVRTSLANAFVTKPFDIHELVSQIETLIKKN